MRRQSIWSQSQAALGPTSSPPETSRQINVLKNSGSQEPLIGNKSRPSPDPLASPQTTVKQLDSPKVFLETEGGEPPHGPSSPSLADSVSGD